MKRQKILWKQCNIFISSTFIDMNSERTFLMNEVFPTLKVWCENHYIDLNIIDLRWGIREEDCRNKQTVRICLENIKESTPFFLCLIGGRRGWIPQSSDIDEETLIKFPFVKDYVNKLSATEMEVYYALNECKRSCLFLKRNSYFVSKIKDEKIKQKYSKDDEKIDETDIYKDVKFVEYYCHVKKLGYDKVYKWGKGIEQIFFSKLGISEELGEFWFENFEKIKEKVDEGQEQSVELSDFTIENESLKEYLLAYYKDKIKTEYPENFFYNIVDEERLKEEAYIQRLSSQFYFDEKYINELNRIYDDTYNYALTVLDANELEISKIILSRWIVLQRSNCRDNIVFFYDMQSGNLKDLCYKLIEKGIIPDTNIKENEDLLEKFLRRIIEYYNQGKKVILVLPWMLARALHFSDKLQVPQVIYIVSWVKHRRAIGIGKCIYINGFFNNIEKKAVIDNFLKMKLKRLSQEDYEALYKITRYKELIDILDELMYVSSYEKISDVIKAYVQSKNKANFIFENILIEVPILESKKGPFLGMFCDFVSAVDLGRGYIICCSINEYMEITNSRMPGFFTKKEIRDGLMYYSYRMKNVTIRDDVIYIDTKGLITADFIFSTENIWRYKKREEYEHLHKMHQEDKVNSDSIEQKITRYRTDYDVLKQKHRKIEEETAILDVSMDIHICMLDIFIKKLQYVQDEKELCRIVYQIPKVIGMIESFFRFNIKDEDKGKELINQIVRRLLENYRFIKKVLELIGYEEFSISSYRSLFVGDLENIYWDLREFISESEVILKQDISYFSILFYEYYQKTQNGVIQKLVEGAFVDIEANRYLRPTTKYEKEEISNYWNLIQQIAEIFYVVLDEKVFGKNSKTKEFWDTGVEEFCIRIIGYLKKFVVIQRPLMKYTADQTVFLSGNEAGTVTYSNVKADADLYIVEIRKIKDFSVIERLYFRKQINKMKVYDMGIEFYFIDGEIQRWVYTTNFSISFK